ncbi:type II/IV secretion system protein [Pelomonas sp. V22]|uniref:GspE/PulE family protein n=1 Tax=Pelomonas sp. V22 TaxID=2822139 RepID=UPI0024A8FED2|nr:GspE/PulE family protein [Pelomonas sp. V22]MDI4632505.1 type II/IV secretion system protein [Pelomonas sp. V22]
MPARPDGELLLQSLLSSGLVSSEAAERARVLGREAGLSLAQAMLRLNAIAELPLYQALSAAAGMPLLDEEPWEPARLAQGMTSAVEALGLSRAWLELKGALVIRSTAASGEGWLVALRDLPQDEVREVFNRKARALAVPFEWRLILPSQYEQVLRSKSLGDETSVGGDDLRALRELAEEGPTVELVNGVLSQAVTQRASDVHFEPGEHEFVVRVRVDGDMLEQARYGRDRFDAVACRLKILSSLDIAERRLPQDGRISARVNGESFDIRVSVLPGATGESIVLRLLRQERKPTRLQDLGMTPAHARMFESWSSMPNGIVLVTGPTGSGKSTTLYTALELANDRSKKIITVEDPVEYKIKGITQLQVNADIGFTFAAALRSILRHDPDTILLGEIRDEETARIAIQSALTGHLVLSTLHTNSAIGAITRLADMGIEPFLLAASIRGLMAQRLVRRLCEHCALPDEQPDEALRALLARTGLAEGAKPRRPVGCVQCAGTGYLGRLAVYDLIEVSPQLAHLIAQGEPESALLAALGRGGEDGLLVSGIEMVARGQSTLAEVLRASGGA